MKDKSNKSKQYLFQIQRARRIAIIAHVNPDADAIGSTLALKRLIRKNLDPNENTIEIDVFFDTQVLDEKYKPLIGNQVVNEQRFKKYDLAIALDCSNEERLGVYDKIFKKASDTLNIDHHATNTCFAKNNIVSTKCSSTCELLFVLLVKFEEWKCSADICSLLYAGIITDTNNLTQNIGFNTLKTITDLTYRGLSDHINLEQIRDYFFKRNTPEQISLLTRALDSINFYCNAQVATMKINKTDFNETNTSQDDTLGIVDYATKLQGVKIGILFIKQEDNSYYVSMRSRDDINVGEIAKKMHGGGHQNIAAFTTNPKQSLTEIKDELFNHCKNELKRTNQEIKIDDFFKEVSEMIPASKEANEIENIFLESQFEDELREKPKRRAKKTKPATKKEEKPNTKAEKEKKSAKNADAEDSKKSKGVKTFLTNIFSKPGKQKENV